MPSRLKKLAQNAIAVGDGEVDESQLLGWLATFTLPDEPRPGSVYIRSWAKHGLDVDDLPEARQPVHVFQSACASVRSRRAPGSNGRRIEITADEIADTPDQCSYQITMKVWDRANDVIEHEKAMRVRFDKHTSAIDVDELDAFDERMYDIEARIRAHFDANAKTVPGAKIRNAIRDQILKIGGQNLRRKAGGLYFVPTTWVKPDGNGGKRMRTRPILDGLAGVLKDLYGDRGDFYTIDLAGKESTREMVRKHFVINANDKARELAEKAIQLMRKERQRGVRSEAIANLWNEKRRLMGAVAQFEELVALEQKDLAANLKDLDNALDELQKFVDEK